MESATDKPDRAALIAQLLEQLEKQADDGIVDGLITQIDSIRETYTEKGNAQRLVSMFGETFKYVSELGRWIIWNGNRWVSDPNHHKMTQLMEDVVLALKDQASTVVNSQSSLDEESQKELRQFLKANAQWVRQSRSKRVIDNSIALAAAEDDVTISVSEIDSKPHYFGCANGVLDLRDRTFVDNDPAFLMLKRGAIEYDPNVSAPDWVDFVLQICSGDQEKARLLQQIAGSMLVGGTKDKMFIFYGSGGNGKTTFTEILQMILGSTADDGYSATISPDVILGKGNTPEYFLADVKGARAVFLSEPSAGGIGLDDGIVKRLVDHGEGMQARVVRGRAFRFVCEATVIMGTNRIPRVNAFDDGMWRRVELVKFVAKFVGDDADRTLKDRLKKQLPGILNWVVEGAQMYLENGKKFEVPETVKADTLEWKSNEDKIGAFLDTAITKRSDGKIKLTEFRKRYSDWCDERGYYVEAERELRKKLEDRAIEFGKVIGGSVALRGVAWKEDDEFDDADQDEFDDANQDELARIRNRRKLNIDL